MKVLFAICITLIGTQVFAGDSGCGLGAVVIQKNSKILQLLSMTTNHSFFTQPLGITFGTSDCSASGIVSNEEEIRFYVQSNQEELSADMAKGQGEKLQVLAALYGCQGNAKNDFAKFTQGSYEKIYTSSNVNPADVVQNLNSHIVQNDGLRKACNIGS